jgi:hypothetical protein
MDVKEESIKRNRITLYLLLAGGAVLMIPLLVLLYIRATEAASGGPDAASHPFAHRENLSDRIKAAQTPAPPPGAQSSLAGAVGMPQPQNASQGQVPDSMGFIKGGSDYLPAEKTSTQTAQTQPAPPPAPKPEVAKNDASPKSKSKTKSGPKPFTQPRLQNSKFSSTFKGKGFGAAGQRGGQTGQPGQMPPGGMPQMPGGAGMPDMSSMMQGMMPGGAGGAAGGAGMPDMSKMMQGMMPGGAGAAPQGTAPAAGTTQKK